MSIGVPRRLSALRLGLVALLMACAKVPRENARTPIEFLVVSDDSTAWVRSASDTVVVHRAPLLLATLAGRLIEIYVAEESLDFSDASFLVTRVFRRDLASGDSTMVFADSSVLREAMAYVSTHPAAERLDPDDAPANGALALESAVTPLDVVGHLLGLEVHVDRTRGDAGSHDSYRATIDLRTGRRMTLAQVTSPVAAAAVFARAERGLRESVALAAQREGPVGRAASQAMSVLRFDSLSFSLTRAGDSLASQFLAHADQVIDESRDTHRFALEALLLPSPRWWARARESLPSAGADSAARVELESVSLQLRYDADEVASIAQRTKSTVRPIARMRGPVRRIIAVGDSLTLPAGAWRSALERAFTEADYYSGTVRAASLRPRARPTAARQAAL